MYISLLYHFKCAIINLYFNKIPTVFTALSYFIGLILPLFVVLMIYHDEIQTKESLLKQSEQIVRVSTSLSIKDATSYLEQWKEDESIEQVFYKTEHSGIISSDKTTRFEYYVYVDPFFYINYKQFMETGRWFDANNQDECIISKDLVYKFFENSDALGTIYINGDACTVIGTTKVFNNRVIKRHDSYQAWDGYTQFFVKLKQLDMMEQMIPEMQHILPEAKIQSLKSINEQYVQGQRVNFGLLFLITLSVFIYAMITISNVIHFMLDERKYRYGINLALGSKKSKLYIEFFLELLVVTSFSFVAALLAFSIAESSIEKYVMPIRIDAVIITILFLCNIVVCLLLSFIYLRKLLLQDVISLIRGIQ